MIDIINENLEILCFIECIMKIKIILNSLSKIEGFVRLFNCN